LPQSQKRVEHTQTHMVWVLNNETGLFNEIIVSTCYPHFSLYVAIMACAYSRKKTQVHIASY